MSTSKLEFEYQNALKRDDLDVVKAILSLGVSPNYMFMDGKRPIHIAILYNNENVGRYLVKCPGIDLDACDSNGTSPLFLAN
jgi:ankyrin repeat protein